MARRIEITHSAATNLWGVRFAASKEGSVNEAYCYIAEPFPPHLIRSTKRKDWKALWGLLPRYTTYCGEDLLKWLQAHFASVQERMDKQLEETPPTPEGNPNFAPEKKADG
jgi:hypothetical protein